MTRVLYLMYRTELISTSAGWFRGLLLLVLCGFYQPISAPLECVFTGPQLDDLPTTQTLVSFVEHSKLEEEWKEGLRKTDRETCTYAVFYNTGVLAVTCPGVRALTGWESEIHTEPFMFSVTVQGAGKHQKKGGIFCSVN